MSIKGCSGLWQAEGHVHGWGDPRLLTLAGLRRGVALGVRFLGVVYGLGQAF